MLTGMLQELDSELAAKVAKVLLLKPGVAGIDVEDAEAVAKLATGISSNDKVYNMAGFATSGEPCWCMTLQC